MKTLDERLAALPEWPSLRPDVFKSLSAATLLRMERDCALARLALAREWIAASPHRDPCPPVNCEFIEGHFEFIEGPCSCGRDALLKALEAPR